MARPSISRLQDEVTPSGQRKLIRQEQRRLLERERTGKEWARAREDRRQRQNEHIRLIHGVDHLKIWPDIPDKTLQMHYYDAELDRRDFEDAGGIMPLYEEKERKKPKRLKRPKGPVVLVKKYSNPIRKPNYNG